MYQGHSTLLLTQCEDLKGARQKFAYLVVVIIYLSVSGLDGADLRQYLPIHITCT